MVPMAVPLTIRTAVAVAGQTPPGQLSQMPAGAPMAPLLASAGSRWMLPGAVVVYQKVAAASPETAKVVPLGSAVVPLNTVAGARPLWPVAALAAPSPL